MAAEDGLLGSDCMTSDGAAVAEVGQAVLKIDHMHCWMKFKELRWNSGLHVAVDLGLDVMYMSRD